MPPEPYGPTWATKFRFTKASLYATRSWFLANSAKDQLDCYDTECVGLIAVIYQSGRINFRARPTVHKRRISMSLDDYGIQNTIEHARLKCHAARIQAAQGIDPRAASRVGITFGELCANHYFPAVEKRKRSVKDDHQKVDRWLTRWFGHMPLTAIKSSDNVAFLDMLSDKERLAPATVNRYLALLKAIWRFGVENDLCQKSPVKHIRPLAECNARTRVLTADECSAFMLACTAEGFAGALFMLLLLTAARLGEGLAAKVEDIDLDGGVWYLPMTKSGKAAYICLSDAAVELLRDVIGDRKAGFLFPGKRAGAAMTRPAKAFERVCAGAGIDTCGAFTIHDLRRTWASLAVNAGVSLFTVSKALRHSSPNVTAARYAHLQDETLINANNVVGALVC